MKIQALIEILFILLSKNKVSAKYLAERLGVSLRSVYRYIDELSIALPIYNTRGRNGGFSVSETYKLPASFFTKEESEFLTGVLNGMNNEVNSQILSKILDKITAITKKSNENTTLDFGNLIIDGGPWGNVEGYKESVTFFENAIENKKIVRISYLSRNGIISERDVEPHTLILKQGLWYVYAYCLSRKEFRLFKLGRIEKVNDTGKVFTRRSTEKIKETLNEWYENLSVESVSLKIDKTAKADVEEWLGVDKISKLKDGNIVANFNLPIDDILVGKILSFGNKVKVEEPKLLKKLVKTAAEEVIKLY
ncbi:MAG: YafY family transcriptional regulator [Clostridia bacterium]|nr:YafY family transcriptional regulator [Clostridia bacterium]